MSAPLPKGLHHLESKVPHKFTHRFSPRVAHKKAYVPPETRVKFWNIRQGDKVRLMVGKPKETHHLAEPKAGEEEGAKLDWRVHEVTELDRERNRVMLKSVTYKKSNQIYPRPANYSALSEEEKAQADNQPNFLVLSRPVHYSNVQLCVKQRSVEDGGSLFATRLKTSRPEYDKLARTWRYERYAANVVGQKIRSAKLDGPDGVGLDVIVLKEDEGRKVVRIPWPEVEKKVMGDAGPLDTSATTSAKSTLTLSSPDEIWTEAASVPLPNSARAASLQLPRAISDKYITSLEDATSIMTTARTLAADARRKDSAPQTYEGILATQVDPVVDSLMPLYLTDELSPRFSRAKATRGWSVRKQEEDRERKEFVAAAVDSWRSGGKDQGLEQAMEQVGLDGVRLRRRTLQEVETVAAREYDVAKSERARIMRVARANGGRWDLEENRWKVELSGSEVRRKEKKLRRRDAREEKLRTMEL